MTAAPAKSILFVALSLYAVVACGPASAEGNDAAFTDPAYKKVSSQPLGCDENTMTYAYLDEGLPCGTLMRDFTAKGSVYKGEGPGSALARAVCRSEHAGAVPDEYSFRTFSCENFSADGRIIGRATFAFTCTGPDGKELPHKNCHKPVS